MITVKELLPKKVRLIVLIILAVGAIIGFLGVFLNIPALVMIGAVVMVCAVIFYFILYRCPHCGKFLDRSTGEFCPYCGKEVNK